MRLRSILLIGGLVFALASVFVISAVLYITGDPLNITAPRDSQLLKTFHDHHDAFEQIRLMAAQDMQHGWYLGLSEMSKIDESRQSQYERQISQIQSGLKVGVGGQDGVVRFIFANGSRLLAIGDGWAKGIEYIPVIYNKQGRMTNLDMMQNVQSGVYLRQIDTNWFIFYQKTD